MDDLAALVAEELALPVDPRVTAMAAAIAAQHGAASRAVLFYGSCLREAELDGLMLDFYLIVSDYDAAYGKSWLARANRLLPPNVFPFQQGGLAAKFAVLSEADFARMCSLEATDVSVWARFAQPSRLVWASDQLARQRAVQAVASAAPTLLGHTLPMLQEPDALAVWQTGFALTYRAELRAERGGRGASIVDSDPARYERFGVAARAHVQLLMSPEATRRWWRRTQRRGKLLTLARLAKASATFAGGIDYLAWKINRHAGTAIAIKPWQRRWPILGAISLLPRLVARGAVR
ncbi:MAG: hypothetical protein JOY99_15775 [Sphingomonadaceae bacterium]|nr:hypothetical protein [Sphingomonadaceae bacterium]